MDAWMIFDGDRPLQSNLGQLTLAQERDRGLAFARERDAQLALNFFRQGRQPFSAAGYLVRFVKGIEDLA